MATGRLNMLWQRASHNLFTTNAHSFYSAVSKSGRSRMIKENANDPRRPRMSKLLKKYRDPLAPIRPISSYLMFSADYRKQHEMSSLSRSTMTAVSTKISSAWRQLPETEKMRYQEKYDLAKAEYRRKQREYEDNQGPDRWLKRILKLSEGGLPPSSGYHLYLRENLGVFKTENLSMPQSEILSVS